MFRGPDFPTAVSAKNVGWSINSELYPVYLSSSGSLDPSVFYTIYTADDKLYKFGVSDFGLKRYNQSLNSAPPNSYGVYSDVIFKGRAHAHEKYMRSLHYNSTLEYDLPGMRIPYPRDFDTGLKITQ